MSKKILIVEDDGNIRELLYVRALFNMLNAYKNF